MSVAKTARSSATSASRPCAGIARRSTRWPSPRPIQTTPRMVNDSDTVAVWRVSANSTNTNASGSVRNTPAASHPAPPTWTPTRVARRPAKPASVRARNCLARPVELVERQHAGHRDERGEPPAAEVGGPEHDGQPDRGHREARGDVAHRPPKRLRRPAYSSSAWRRSRSPKSGQRVSTKTSSEYAICQSRKFDIRNSPEVRIRRSGSGISGA